MWFTYVATEWRIGIRRRMNDSDTDANTKAIDSLLNYETVKYFAAEEREAQALRPLDGALRGREREVLHLARRAQRRAGGDLHHRARASTMVMCAYGIRHGTNTVGDFVMINAMMIQLYQPLNFMGMVYREIKQATDRHRDHVRHPAAAGRRSRTGRTRKPLAVGAGAHPLRERRASPTSRRGRSSRA